MHLVSTTDQQVRVPGAGVVRFAGGESIRTEISCKYDRASLTDLLGAAGMRIERWISDAASSYAMVLASLHDVDGDRA
jgi:L-histidine N-alpha-methyltransferase